MRRSSGLCFFFASAVLCVALAPACGDGGATGVTFGLDAGLGDGSSMSGAGVGAPCDPARPCRVGLTCSSGTCQATRSTELGAPCLISAECKSGTFCGGSRTCEQAGTGGDGAACQSDSACISGFRCNAVGLSTQCQAEGTADLGGQCTSSGACLGGLYCVEGSCASLPPGTPVPLGASTWKGTECPPDDPGPAKVYFRVPRGAGDGDFFRLPFPNDVRMQGGRPKLDGFPTPGPGIVGFDVVDRYLRDVEANSDGFSAYTTVNMRFSADIDFESLKPKGTVRWVDVTPGQGQDRSWGFGVTSGRNAYICPRSIGIRPAMGDPLVPGHTYAVLITNAAKSGTGAPLQADADLKALLGNAAPGDGALAAAHAAYAPLRAWAQTKAFDLGTLAGATVFTVNKAPGLLPKLAESVAAAAVPTSTGWVKCGSGPSPCPDAIGARNCAIVDETFDELHALVTLPVFQQGTAPYLTPADGGDLALDGSGRPQVQRTEAVCLALTVPHGTMPTGGWPLVIYAHGTGGSYRSHIAEGVGRRLALVDEGATPIAVLGIDQVQHGPRRGGSKDGPDKLFYNFANPKASRGNTLQGAADQLALLRFAKSFTLPAGQSPTAAEIRFGNVAFWGHSQGATEVSVAVPYVAGVSGVLLSGQGASLLDALLTKKSPVNVAAVMPIALQDATVDATHPVLSILQDALDVVDPLNHAAGLARSAPAGTARHVFQPYGQGDTFSPPVTEATFALAAGLVMAAHPANVLKPDAIGDLKPSPLPLGGNLDSGGRKITAVVRQYAAPDFDGHFVSTRDPSGRVDTARFLADALAGKTPRIGR